MGRVTATPGPAAEHRKFIKAVPSTFPETLRAAPGSWSTLTPRAGALSPRLSSSLFLPPSFPSPPSAPFPLFRLFKSPAFHSEQ